MAPLTAQQEKEFKDMFKTSTAEEVGVTEEEYRKIEKLFDHYPSDKVLCILEDAIEQHERDCAVQAQIDEEKSLGYNFTASPCKEDMKKNYQVMYKDDNPQKTKSILYEEDRMLPKSQRGNIEFRSELTNVRVFVPQHKIRSKCADAEELDPLPSKIIFNVQTSKKAPTVTTSKNQCVQAPAKRSKTVNVPKKEVFKKPNAQKKNQKPVCNQPTAGTSRQALAQTRSIESTKKVQNPVCNEPIPGTSRQALAQTQSIESVKKVQKPVCNQPTAGTSRQALAQTRSIESTKKVQKPVCNEPIPGTSRQALAQTQSIESVKKVQKPVCNQPTAGTSRQALAQTRSIESTKKVQKPVCNQPTPGTSRQALAQTRSIESTKKVQKPVCNQPTAGTSRQAQKKYIAGEKTNKTACPDPKAQQPAKPVGKAASKCVATARVQNKNASKSNPRKIPFPDSEVLQLPKRTPIFALKHIKPGTVIKLVE